MNRIQSTIESLHAKQGCPRLHVDTTRPAVVCPDFLREQWKEQLVIDLDPSWPLELAFTEAGVEANLSFRGYVTRCVFPWDAIYAVVDRETGRGIVIETAVPASLRAKQAAAQQAAAKPKPKLVEVGSVPEEAPPPAKVSADEARKSRRNRRKKPEAEVEPQAEVEAPVEAEAPAEVPVEPKVEVKSEPSASDREPESVARDREAKRRRAAFKVIDSDD